MGITIKEYRRETVIDFFNHEVACGVIHLKNGDSFTFYNNTFKPLSYGSNNENVVMKAVCKVNQKLDND
jgi:beta-galactosidase beta subunit